MCHYLGAGLHGKQKRVKAQSESSKSVVNSVLISREMPVFPGFLEIIRVVFHKNKEQKLFSAPYLIFCYSDRRICPLIDLPANCLLSILFCNHQQNFIASLNKSGHFVR